MTATAEAPAVPTLEHSREVLYIDGQWVPSTGTGTLPVTNPFTEQVVGTVPDGTAEDVDAAARAAARALPEWSQTPLEERVDACRRIADGLKKRAGDIALYASTEMGAPWQIAVMVQAGLPVIDFASMEDVADQVEWERHSGNSLLVRKPAGVVGAITPWNYPLHQISAKVAPTLLGGGTIVVKPSELVPGVAYVLAEVVHAAGLPAGVFNLVTGTGPVVGEAIVRHEAVDMVSFTGSTRAGRRVAELASAAPKRTSLELGGKSASVLLDDLSAEELGNAVAGSLTGCLINSGQTCSATTRLVVPRDRVDEVCGLLEVFTQFAVMGDPLDPQTQQGPLVSKVQQERVRAYITAAVDDGARLVAGGPEQPDHLPTGFFVKPTVLVAEAGTTIEQEEVFGPVLTVVPYDGGEKGALAVANGTPYGLSGAVWASDRDRAIAFAKRMRTGQVGVNGGVFNPTAPFGGFGQSGYGRELGPLGVEEFTAITSLQL
ncbi:MAG: aldehyde dehydrogenase family protein [Actinomycetes bacterium]